MLCAASVGSNRIEPEELLRSIARQDFAPPDRAKDCLLDAERSVKSAESVLAEHSKRVSQVCARC